MISIDTQTDTPVPEHFTSSPSLTAWSVFVTRMPRLFRQWQQWRPDQPLTIRMWTLDERRKTPPIPHAFHGVIQAVAASGVVLRVTGQSGTFPQFVSWTDLWTGTAEVLTPGFREAGSTARAESDDRHDSPSRGV